MTKLLLCDDDESNRLTTGALLEEEGYEVELAGSYVEGWTRAAWTRWCRKDEASRRCWP